MGKTFRHDKYGDNKHRREDYKRFRNKRKTRGFENPYNRQDNKPTKEQAEEYEDEYENEY